jgi:hypothetical protein
MKPTRRYNALCLAILLAVAAGIGAGRLHSAKSASTAYAAAHCTRYGPNYAVDPANCGAKYTMSDGIYITNSTAVRDGNTITMNSSHYWDLWLEDSGNNFHQVASGSSGFGSSTGGWSGYAYAGCDHGGTPTGQCYTYWHD